MSKEKIKIKLNSQFHQEVDKSIIEFINQNGTVANDGDSKYMFLPFWIKEEDSEYKIVKLEDGPDFTKEYLIRILNKLSN